MYILDERERDRLQCNDSIMRTYILDETQRLVVRNDFLTVKGHHGESVDSQ